MEVLQNIAGGMEMKTIFLIAPNEEIYRHGKILQKKRFKEIKVSFGLIQEGVEQALKESRRGAEIFVTRARTAEAIKEAEVPGVLVRIPVTAYDILRAISEARKISEKISVVAFSEMIGSMELFSNLLDVENLMVFSYEQEKEADTVIEEAIQKGAKVIIGGETTKRAAEKRGIPFVQIVTGEEAVIQALEEAERIAEIRSMEKTRIQLLETVAHFSAEAILIVNQEMKVTMGNWNFYQMSGFSEKDVLSRSIFEIWSELKTKKWLQNKENQYDELIKFQGKDVLCNKTMIRVGKEITGIVFSFQEVEEIRQREAKLRRSIYVQEYKTESSFLDILGESKEIQKTIQMGKEFALTDSPILLVGEIGSGKNLFAQSIHQYSPRSSGAYVEVKCSSLAGKGFAQEMMGEVGVAGAPGKPGLFEIAHKGTLFLNEITELDLEAQGKLLNVLQQKKVARLGNDKWLPIDIRIIASTGQDMKKAIREGRFRADLYYQLNVLQLKIPSLNERREDIPILAQSFLKKLEKGRKKALNIHEDALMLLYRHQWSGNVKELFNLMERIAVTCHEEAISRNFLQSILGEDLAPGVSHAREIIQQDKIEMIREALKESKGNYGVAARRLGIDRSTLWRRLKKLGLK